MSNAEADAISQRILPVVRNGGHNLSHMALARPQIDIEETPQAVSKIVMDTARGSLTSHWHQADEPSDPIYFAWVHGRALNNAGYESAAPAQNTAQKLALGPATLNQP
jgi:hypothetical protein